MTPEVRDLQATLDGLRAGVLKTCVPPACRPLTSGPQARATLGSCRASDAPRPNHCPMW
jgi:hypothetical protein